MVQGFPRRAGSRVILALRELEIFVEVANSGSFTKAAQRLGLSTGTVSRRIVRLETTIAVRLFFRNTRRLHLTQDGEFFLREIKEGLERLNGAHLRLHESHNSIRGTVKAFLQNTFAKNYVMPALKSFMARYPLLHLELHVEEEPEDLVARGYDLAVQIGPPHNSNYVARRLGEPYVVLVASPAYLQSYGVPQSVKDLDAHERICLGPTAAEPYIWRLARTADRHRGEAVINHRPQGRYFFAGQLDAAIHAAVDGLGITPCDIGACRHHFQSGALRIVLPDYEWVHPGNLYLLYPHRDHLPVRVRMLIDFIVEVAQTRLRPTDFDPHAFAADAPQRNLRAIPR